MYVCMYVVYAVRVLADCRFDARPPDLIIKYFVDFIWKWCAAGSQQSAFRLFVILPFFFFVDLLLAILSLLSLGLPPPPHSLSLILSFLPVPRLSPTRLIKNNNVKYSARILTIKLALSNKCLCSSFQTHVPALQRPKHYCVRLRHTHSVCNTPSLYGTLLCFIHVEHQIKYEREGRASDAAATAAVDTTKFIIGLCVWGNACST